MKDSHKPSSAQDTRRALLDAGLKGFARFGYSGTSVQSITAAAGVNRALISYHFGGKRGLLEALHEEVFARISPQMERLPDKALTAEANLQEFIAVFGELASVDPDFPVMLLRGLMSEDEDPDSLFSSRLLEFNRVLQAILGKGQREGAFRKVDVLMTQASVLGSLLFFFATEATRSRLASTGKIKTAPRARDFVSHVQDMALRWLSP